MALLPNGIPAPGFQLNTTPDQKVSLSDFRGRNVVLAFYPADWSPVCGDELSVLNEVIPILKKHDAELVGISVDGPWCHMAFSEAKRFRFPLLSDFEPKGEVARLYNAYRPDDGFCERALYLIDGGGDIRWSKLSPVEINPGVDGLLDALEKISGEGKLAS